MMVHLGRRLAHSHNALRMPKQSFAPNDDDLMFADLQALRDHRAQFRAADLINNQHRSS